MTLFAELKRRDVIGVGAAYAVVGWLVIQVAETIFPLFGFDDTPARIVVIVLAIGFIPALIFAWAFELTPEGLKKESEVDRSQSVTPHTGKKLDRMIMVGLAVALGYFAFDKFVLDPQREAAKDEQKAVAVEQARQVGRSEALVESCGDKSIAVLPFVNMSSDAEQEYFSDGISEELLNLLGAASHVQEIDPDAALAELIEQHGREAASSIASVLAYRNEADRAFEWLDKAVESGELGLHEITLDSLFSSIHEDPRWRPLVERIGKTPEQLAAIKFEVELPGQ